MLWAAPAWHPQSNSWPPWPWRPQPSVAQELWTKIPRLSQPCSSTDVPSTKQTFAGTSCQSLACSAEAAVCPPVLGGWRHRGPCGGSATQVRAAHPMHTLEVTAPHSLCGQVADAAKTLGLTVPRGHLVECQSCPGLRIPWSGSLEKCRAVNCFVHSDTKDKTFNNSAHWTLISPGFPST